MILFCPYPNFAASAYVMSAKDLFDSRMACVRMLRCFYPDNHYNRYREAPIGRAWKGYQASLYFYLQILENEWEKRQYKDQFVLPKTFEDCEKWRFTNECLHVIEQPPWLGWEELHSSHRARLLWSDYQWYRMFGWKEKPFPTVVWPSPSVSPGDHIVRGSLVALVVLVRKKAVTALLDGVEIKIPQEDIRRRVWTRAISVQL